MDNDCLCDHIATRLHVTGCLHVARSPHGQHISADAYFSMEEAIVPLFSHQDSHNVNHMQISEPRNGVAHFEAETRKESLTVKRR
jgi:hypothetical protein